MPASHDFEKDQSYNEYLSTVFAFFRETNLDNGMKNYFETTFGHSYNGEPDQVLKSLYDMLSGAYTLGRIHEREGIEEEIDIYYN